MTGLQRIDDPGMFTYGLSGGNEKRELFVMKEIVLRFSRPWVIRLSGFVDPFPA
jgi:hypothetical protein